MTGGYVIVDFGGKPNVAALGTDAISEDLFNRIKEAIKIKKPILAVNIGYNNLNGTTMGFMSVRSDGSLVLDNSVYTINDARPAGGPINLVRVPLN